MRQRDKGQRTKEVATASSQKCPEKVIKWGTNSVKKKWGETSSPKITKIGTKQCFCYKKGYIMLQKGLVFFIKVGTLVIKWDTF